MSKNLRNSNAGKCAQLLDIRVLGGPSLGLLLARQSTDFMKY